jgi:adenylate cyclase
MAAMSPISPHAMPQDLLPLEGATALYFAAGEFDGMEAPPSADDWAVAERYLSRQIKSEGGQWWHRSASGLCVAFPRRRAALHSAWRLPLLSGLKPSQRWRMSLDAVRHLVEVDVGQVARLHDLTQLADDKTPVVGHRLRDQLNEPLEAQLEDLGLCHFKGLHPAQRVYRLHKPVRPAAAVSDPDGLPRLVMLAPKARADSPAHRAFGALLVDRLAHQLGRSRHVRLVHPMSCRRLGAQEQAEDEAHRWLGADYLLQGHYRVLGSRGQGTLEVLLSLHSVRAGAVVWEQVFRAQVGDVLASESALVQAVSAGVHHAVLDAHMDWVRQQPIHTLGDYELLTAGVGLMHRSAPDDFDASRQALLALLERAPEMGQAHAWLAKWHVLRVTRALSTEPAQEAAAAQVHAQRAMVASDAQGLARAMQGFVRLHLQRDLPGALQDLRQACVQHPNEPLAWLFRGVAESFADVGIDAMHASRRALSLSPLDPLLYYFESLAASSAIVHGDGALARRWCEQSLRRNLMHLSTHRAYITALWMAGDLAAARRAALQMLRLAPGYTVAQFERSGSSARTRLGQCVHSALVQAGVPLRN